MGFKKIQIWLQGGVIGGIISIILLICFQFAERLVLSSLSNPYPYVPGAIKWFCMQVFFMIIPLGFGTGVVYRISTFMLLLIICFFIGAVIGLIIDKTKSKK